MELVYQAAAHIRLFCENVITLRYILLRPEERAEAFLDYSAIDAYKIGNAYLEWESQTAQPRHVQAMKVQQGGLQKRFDEVHQRYEYVDRKGKTREFRSWCNRSLKDQADDCGADMQKLYAIGYRQLSAYVHGSAWALRRQAAYIRTGYDETVVMIDFANLTRVLLVIWIEWLKIMTEELGWQALGLGQGIVDRCNELDEATVQVVAKMREEHVDGRSSEEGRAVNGDVRCVLCDEPAPEGSASFRLTRGASQWLKRACPDSDSEAALARNVICPNCQTLPPDERRDLARRALARELKSYRDFVRSQV